MVLGLLATSAIVTEGAFPPYATTAFAQAEAVRKYPPLGQADSAFNREFVNRFNRYETEQPDFFKDPAWPVVLANQVAKYLRVTPADGAGSGSSKATTSADLGAQVISFCRQNFGSKIGNGECSTLVGQALQAAGAAGIIRGFPRAGDYVWERGVAVIEAGRNGPELGQSLANVAPGDVVQFRDARFKGRSHDGGNGTYWADRLHHSAVVAAIDPGLCVLIVIEQNVSRPSKVTQNTLYLSDLKTGWMRFCRPEPLLLKKSPSPSAAK